VKPSRNRAFRNLALSAELALHEIGTLVDSKKDSIPEMNLMEAPVNGWYGPLFSMLKALGLLAFVGAVARGFVAFGTWRIAFRNRLLGEGPREQEVS
jgi:hypothetical protein